MFILIIILLIATLCLYSKEIISEHFFPEECDIKSLPLNALGCINVPNHPIKHDYINKYANECRNITFNQIVPKNGKFTFKIPELKYDGIYSRNQTPNSCNWDCKNEHTNLTYGTNNYLHVPDYTIC